MEAETLSYSSFALQWLAYVLRGGMWSVKMTGTHELKNEYMYNSKCEQ